MNGNGPFDANGKELNEGDEVTIRATVIGTHENSQNVRLRTAEPQGREGMHTDLSIRADSVQKS
jgi:hypothetical protein